MRKALRTTVVDNQALTETICSRTPSQLRRLKEVYLSTYHSSLETDIENELSGDHKRVLIYLKLLLSFWNIHFYYTLSVYDLYIQGENIYYSEE